MTLFPRSANRDAHSQRQNEAYGIHINPSGQPRPPPRTPALGPPRRLCSASSVGASPSAGRPSLAPSLPTRPFHGGSGGDVGPDARPAFPLWQVAVV